MPYTEAQARASKRYREKNLDKFKEYSADYESQFASYKIRMTKEQKSIVEEKAKAEGKSINKYIIDRIIQ